MAKKLGKIKVSRAYHKADDVHLVAFLNGIVTTGDPTLNQPTATPPVQPVVTDVTLKAKATILLHIIAGRQIKPPTYTANDETVARNEALLLLDELADQATPLVNKVSAAANDEAAGLNALEHIGFLSTGKGHHGAHTLQQLPSGKGTCLAQFPHAGRGTTYVARVARANSDDVVTGTWSNNIPVHVTGLLISGGNLKSGDRVALQLGFEQTTAGGTTLPKNAMERAIAPISTKSTKKKHIIPTYIFGTDPITWGSAILFMTVQ